MNAKAISTVSGFRVILVVTTILLTVLTIPGGFALAASVYQGNGYGPIIDRGEIHDYEPSAVRIHPGQLRVWTCTGRDGRDAIDLTIFNTDHPTGFGNIAYGPWQSLLPSPASTLYFDIGGACAPSVVGRSSGYRMYYECTMGGSYPHNTLQICFASSNDYGASWAKSGVVVPNPGLAPGAKYGIGHPSALVDGADRRRTFLYYYDGTKDTDGTKGVVRRVVLAENGVTWVEQSDVKISGQVLHFPVKVKYYDPAWTDGKGGYFVATSLMGTNGKFRVWTASDGINFQYAGDLFVPGSRCGQDPGQVIADADGWIRSRTNDLQALIGADDLPNSQCTPEGGGGPKRGVYLTRFGINLP